VAPSAFNKSALISKLPIFGKAIPDFWRVYFNKLLAAT
jgi:hypothetical protein